MKPPYLPPARSTPAPTRLRRLLLRTQGVLLLGALAFLSGSQWSPVAHTGLFSLTAAACVILGVVAWLGCRPFLSAGSVTAGEREITGGIGSFVLAPLLWLNLVFPALLALLLLSIVFPPGCTRRARIGPGAVEPPDGAPVRHLDPIADRARRLVEEGPRPAGGWLANSAEAQREVAAAVVEAFASPGGPADAVRGKLPAWVEEAIDLAVLQAAPYHWRVSALEHASPPWPEVYRDSIRDRLSAGAQFTGRGPAHPRDRVRLGHRAGPAAADANRPLLTGVLLVQGQGGGYDATFLADARQGSPGPTEVRVGGKSFTVAPGIYGFQQATLESADVAYTGGRYRLQNLSVAGHPVGAADGPTVYVLPKVPLLDDARLRDTASAAWCNARLSGNSPTDLTALLHMPASAPGAPADSNPYAAVHTFLADGGRVCVSVVAPPGSQAALRERLLERIGSREHVPKPGTLVAGRLTGSVGPLRQRVGVDFLIQDLLTDTQQYGAYKARYPVALPSGGGGRTLRVTPVVRDEMIFDGFHWDDATVGFADNLPFCARVSVSDGGGRAAEGYVILAPAQPKMEADGARGVLTLSLLLARHLFFEEQLARLGADRLAAPGEALPVFVLQPADLDRISADAVQTSVVAMLATLVVYFVLILWMGTKTSLS